MGDIFHAEIAAGAAAVLDDEGLAGRLLQRGGDEAADNVGGAARRIGDDELDRPVGVGGDRLRGMRSTAGAATPAASTALMMPRRDGAALVGD